MFIRRQYYNEKLQMEQNKTERKLTGPARLDYINGVRDAMISQRLS